MGKNEKQEKGQYLKFIYIFKVGEKVLNTFKTRKFPLPPTEVTCLKILRSPSGILQRLPIAIAKVKASNIFESPLNEICQIICYFIEQTKLLK